jgi:AcrR family transcriptional regulator
MLGLLATALTFSAVSRCRDSLALKDGTLHGLVKERQRFFFDGLSSSVMEGSLTQLSQVKPGGHELRREVVVHHQRERILAAVVELVAESGYRSLTVARILKRAGVAKLKFYELFSSKEDAFLAAYDAGLEQVTAALAEALADAADSPAGRIAAGIGALLSFFDEHPALARAGVLEAPSVGQAMGDRRGRTLAAFTPLLAGAREGGGGGGAELPAGLEESVLDGLYWLLYDAILTGKPKKLAKLKPALVEFALLPFLGPLAAAEAAAA